MTEFHSIALRVLVYFKLNENKLLKLQSNYLFDDDPMYVQQVFVELCPLLLVIRTYLW